MDYKVAMPRLSDAMDEGKLVEWKVRPGDRVEKGDVIAEVESDKAVMEIQTFQSGTVKQLLVEEGTTVPVGREIAVIETEGETTVSHPESAPGKEERKPSVPRQKEKRPAEAVQSQTRSAAEEIFGSEARQGEEPPREAMPPRDIVETVLSKELSPSLPSSFTEGNASPRAKMLAAQYGLDIEKLQDEKKLPIPAHYDDVKRYYIRRYFTPKALELIARYHLSTSLFEAGKKHNEAEVKAYIEAHEIPLPKPLDIVQKSMIIMLSEAAKRPMYHMSDHIDGRLIKANETKELTITVWLIKLLAEAMMRQESFRMTLDTDTVQIWPNANLSVAMAEGELLYMPVFKEVNKKSVHEIAKQLQSYKEKIAARKLSKEELSGSTFGLSNLGMLGIEQFDAMINKNDCAIAAVGAEKEGKISVTLTVDHRIVNGYQAAEFMQTLKALAKDPAIFKG